MFKAPAIYFPTTVVVLDDDDIYGELLIKDLNIENARYFKSPDFLLKQKKDDFLFIDNCMFEKNKEGDKKYLINNLNKLIESKKLISVIVSDLQMEKILGTELFNELSSPYIGKILISNFLKYQKDKKILLAIKNCKLDTSLDKSPEMPVELAEAIFATKIKFFTLLSNTLFPGITDDHPLMDLEFAKFFAAKIIEMKPQKIIPNNTLNSFNFELDNGTSIVLRITDKDEINSYLSSLAAESAPKEVLKQMALGKFILCHDEDVLPDGQLWPLLIRPAKEFIGKNKNYYFSFSESQSYV